MKKRYSLLFAVLSVFGAAAQVPAPLHLAQTITLPAQTALAGTVQLANRNTVLLLADTELLDLRAQCLAPDGHTLWTTPVSRHQHPKDNPFEQFAPAALGTTSRSRTAEEFRLETLQKNSSLLPLNVFTDGNSLVLVERIYASALKKIPKGTSLRAGQLHVQRLDEQGHLTSTVFEPSRTAEADAEKTRAATLGRYADAQGYVEVLRETVYTDRKKQQVQSFFLLHYDVGATAVRREPLALASTPWLTGGYSQFDDWHQDWDYLGHRANQTYFGRRLLVTRLEERAGRQPLTYQVCITDDHGQAAPGGFSTTLGLAKGSTPAYSGALPNYGELDQATNNFTSLFNTSSGASYKVGGYENVADGAIDTTVGSFYLDHATGDVLIFGEYRAGDLPSADFRPELLGFFEQRYTFDGRTLAQLQAAYAKDLTAHKKAGSFTGQYGRRLRFHLDPLTQQSQYSFAPMHVLGQGEDFDLFADQQLHLERVEYLPGSARKDYIFTAVQYTRPFWLYKTTGTFTEQRRYIHAAATDPPVYAALEKLNATGPQPFHYFHLSTTGPSTGLVIERLDAVGGTLNVYTF